MEYNGKNLSQSKTIVSDPNWLKSNELRTYFTYIITVKLSMEDYFVF